MLRSLADFGNKIGDALRRRPRTSLAVMIGALLAFSAWQSGAFDPLICPGAVSEEFAMDYARLQMAELHLPQKEIDDLRYDGITEETSDAFNAPAYHVSFYEMLDARTKMYFWADSHRCGLWNFTGPGYISKLSRPGIDDRIVP